VPLSVPFVRSRTQIVHGYIAFFHGLPQSRFLGFVKKTHLASAVNPRFIDPPHRVLF